MRQSSDANALSIFVALALALSCWEARSEEAAPPTEVPAGSGEEGETAPPPLEEEAETKTIRLASGEVVLTVGTTYDIIPYEGARIRGSFQNANAHEIKLTVSATANRERVDSVYLPIRNIKAVEERKGARVRVRDELPLAVRDPYEKMRQDLDATAAETARKLEEAQAAAAAAAGQGTQPATQQTPAGGAMDPAIVAQVDAILPTIVAAAPDAAAPAVAAQEQLNQAATDQLRQLGADASPVLVARLGGSSDRQLTALTLALLDFKDERAIRPIIAAYDGRGLYPNSDVVQQLGAMDNAAAAGWLLTLAGDPALDSMSRRLCCASIMQATPNPALADGLQKIVEGAGTDSALARTALSTLTKHADNPVARLLELLSRGNAELAAHIVNELTPLADPTLDAELVAFATENPASNIREQAMRALLRRLTDKSDKSVIAFIVAQGARQELADLLPETLSEVARVQFPHSADVDYEPLLLAAFRERSTHEANLAGLHAVGQLGAAATTPVCQSLLELWKELKVLEANDDPEVRRILMEFPGTVAKIAGRPFPTPEAFQVWLSSR